MRKIMICILIVHNAGFISCWFISLFVARGLFYNGNNNNNVHRYFYRLAELNILRFVMGI